MQLLLESVFAFGMWSIGAYSETASKLCLLEQIMLMCHELPGLNAHSRLESSQTIRRQLSLRVKNAAVSRSPERRRWSFTEGTCQSNDRAGFLNANLLDTASTNDYGLQCTNYTRLLSYTHPHRHTDYGQFGGISRKKKSISRQKHAWWDLNTTRRKTRGDRNRTSSRGATTRTADCN